MVENQLIATVLFFLKPVQIYCLLSGIFTNSNIQTNKQKDKNVSSVLNVIRKYRKDTDEMVEQITDILS